MPKPKKTSKQTTLDNLPNAPVKDAIEIIKSTQEEITITQMSTSIEEEEMTLKVTFKLPSKTVFSKVKANLCFDREQINSIIIKVLQGPLATEESEFTTILDMKGIAAGTHTITTELYGLWTEDEKLCRTIKQLDFKYVPQRRQDRLVRIPSIKSVAGTDVAVVSHSEKELYREIEKTIKKEQTSKRDER